MDAHGLATRRERETGFPNRAALAPCLPFPRIQQNPVQRTTHLLRKYQWTIVACMIITTVVFLIYAARQPRLYRAQAELAIYRDNGANTFDKDSAQPSGDIDYYAISLETELQVLQSRTLALQVVRSLGLDHNSDFAAPQAGEGQNFVGDSDGNAMPTASESSAIDTFVRNLSVVPKQQTRVVDVSFSGRDPKLAAQIVNLLADDFIEDNIRSRYDSANRAIQFLSGRLTDLQMKVDESEEKLVRYEREHNIIGIDEKQNIVTAKLDDLNKQLTQAEADRIGKQAVFQTIATSNLDDMPAVRDNSTLQALHERQAELKNDYAQATSTYGPNHPKVIALSNRLKAIEASIQVEQQRIRGRAQQEYQASLKREQALQQAFNEQKAAANRLNESAIAYSELKRDAESNRQLYENLQSRMKEAGIAAGLRSSNVRVIDAAQVPRKPFTPNLPRSALLGLFAGFLLSAAVVAIREGLDRRLHGPVEIESFTSMPSIAIIPFHRAPAVLRHSQSASPGVVSLVQPHSSIAEAYRALGTAILFRSSVLKTLLVTSALPVEGKTTTATNAAVVLAQNGKRVLLVDADLRKPALHESFGVANDLGLSDLLKSDGVATPIVPCEQLPQLSILAAGSPQEFPAEMLGSPRMAALMKVWCGEYDYIVIDSPPLLPVTDSLRLSAFADSTLLVLRSGHTTREALLRSCDLLNQNGTPVFGIVVNAVDFSSAAYYYGYSRQSVASYYKEHRAP